MKDKPEDVIKILDRFTALQNDIAAFKKEGGPYAALVEQLGLGQRMITSVSRQTGKDTTAESAYQMTFTERSPTDFTVCNGKHTRTSAKCYVIGAASENTDSSCYRVRLYLSASCNGSTTDAQNKPCLVLEWLRGDTGDSGSKNTPTNDHEGKSPHNDDYTLGKVGCAGMSTAATGLGVSSSGASVGFTGASVGFNVFDFAFGLKALKFRGLDYSVTCLGNEGSGMENQIDAGEDDLSVEQVENDAQDSLIEANDNEIE